MKRIIAAAALLVLAGCADTPTQPATSVKPQFETAIGAQRAFVFEGTVGNEQGDLGQYGDVVTGRISFTSTSGEFDADPCVGMYNADMTIEYSINGVVQPTMSGPGLAYTWLMCAGSPWDIFVMGIFENPGDLYASIQLRTALTNTDLPVNPTFASSNSVFDLRSKSDVQGTYMMAYLTVFRPADPQTKAECLKDAWKNFGFVNQGQCVRFVETGKDSR